jgi:hypothetical protein
MPEGRAQLLLPGSLDADPEDSLTEQAAPRV